MSSDYSFAAIKHPKNLYNYLQSHPQNRFEISNLKHTKILETPKL